MWYCLSSQWLSNDVFYGKLEPHPPNSCLSYLDEAAPFATALFCSNSSSFLFASQKPVTLGSNVQTTWAEPEPLSFGTARLTLAEDVLLQSRDGPCALSLTRHPLCFVMVISQPVADICVRPQCLIRENWDIGRGKRRATLNNRCLQNHYGTLPSSL